MAGFEFNSWQVLIKTVCASGWLNHKAENFSATILLDNTSLSKNRREILHYVTGFII